MKTLPPVSYTHLYAVASREDKEAMFLEYSELLNSLDSGATTKITINKMCIRDSTNTCVGSPWIYGGCPPSAVNFTFRCV